LRQPKVSRIIAAARERHVADYRLYCFGESGNSYKSR
jgi:hypothetical protein